MRLRADASTRQGKVVSRAEVPFEAPVAVAAAGPIAAAPGPSPPPAPARPGSRPARDRRRSRHAHPPSGSPRSRRPRPSCPGCHRRPAGPETSGSVASAPAPPHRRNGGLPADRDAAAAHPHPRIRRPGPIIAADPRLDQARSTSQPLEAIARPPIPSSQKYRRRP